MIPAPPTVVVRCACGEITGTPCTWEASVDDAVVVEHMPVHLRASHTAAGNAGRYPHNGAVRLTLAPTCAAERVAADPDWTTTID